MLNYVKHIVPAMWMSTSFDRCLDKKKPTIIIEKKVSNEREGDEKQSTVL